MLGESQPVPPSVQISMNARTNEKWKSAGYVKRGKEEKDEDREERTERPMQRIIPLIDRPWFSWRGERFNQPRRYTHGTVAHAFHQ